MRTALSPETVREIVACIMKDLGRGPAKLADVQETVFLNGSECTARSYRYEGWMAMWLVEDGIVQFYDAQGEMLRTLSVSDRQPSRGRGRAA